MTDGLQAKESFIGPTEVSPALIEASSLCSVPPRGGEFISMYLIKGQHSRKLNSSGLISCSESFAGCSAYSAVAKVTAN